MTEFGFLSYNLQCASDISESYLSFVVELSLNKDAIAYKKFGKPAFEMPCIFLCNIDNSHKIHKNGIRICLPADFAIEKAFARCQGTGNRMKICLKHGNFLLGSTYLQVEHRKKFEILDTLEPESDNIGGVQNVWLYVRHSKLVLTCVFEFMMHRTVSRNNSIQSISSTAEIACLFTLICKFSQWKTESLIHLIRR